MRSILTRSGIKAFGYLASSLLGSLMIAAPTHAQSSSTEIIVTGSEDVDAKQLTAFSHSVTVETSGQVARFHDPICPASIGLDQEHNGLVAQAIVLDVQDVGGRVGKPGCHPNLTAVFVADGHAFVKSLFDAKSPSVATMTLDQQKQLLHQAGPTFAITSTELIGREGDRLRPGALSVSNASTEFLQVRSASIIFKPTRQDINGVVVVIETGSAVGKSLRQLADYVAMRGLAKTKDAPSPERGDTILRLFSKGTKSLPASMTALDEAYLRAIYQGSAPSDGSLQPARRAKSSAAEKAEDRRTMRSK